MMLEQVSDFVCLMPMKHEKWLFNLNNLLKIYFHLSHVVLSDYFFIFFFSLFFFFVIFFLLLFVYEPSNAPTQKMLNALVLFTTFNFTHSFQTIRLERQSSLLFILFSFLLLFCFMIIIWYNFLKSFFMSRLG